MKVLSQNIVQRNNLDLTLQALRTAASTALEVFVGVNIEGQQTS
jgi:hypothetical protein